MEHIQIILERVCKEDMECKKTPVVTIGTKSYFQGKLIGENLSGADVMSFKSGHEAYYRYALDEIMNYRNWLQGIRHVVRSDYYIAECRKNIKAYKLCKTA